MIHNSLRSVLRLPSGFPQVPPCLLVPSFPPSSTLEDLPQSEKGLCWPRAPPAPASRGRGANWLLVSMTLLSDYRDAEEVLETLSYKMLFVVTRQGKAISLREVLAAGHSLTS